MRTSPHQFHLLIKFMEEHGDLSKPQHNMMDRIAVMKHWEDLKVILNSDGSGQIRTTEKWKKVWSDMKNNTKKKAARLHRAAIGLNDGLVYAKMSELEKRVLNVMGMPAATRFPITESSLMKDVGVDTSEPQLPQPGNQEDNTDKIDENIKAWNKAASSSMVVLESQPLSQGHIKVELTTQVEEHISPIDIDLSQSPNLIEENIESTEDTAALSPHRSNLSTPRSHNEHNLYGQTSCSSGRSSRMTTSCKDSRPRIKHTYPAKHYLKSEARWRDFSIKQHKDYIDIKREEIRVRELEVRNQREWQVIALRALDVVDKLIDKCCKD